MAENKYERSIELLNKAVAGEITASMQYMLFHFICEDKGYRPLSKYFEKTGIEEMRHLEMLAERILFLGGEVKMVMQKAVKNIDTVEGMLEYSRQLETDTIEDYNNFSREAGEAGDAGTHKIFQDLVTHEENHMDHFRLERDNMKELGKEYLALQVIDNLKHADE